MSKKDKYQTSQGNEYQIISAHNRIKKIALIISIIWILLIVIPVSYILFLHSNDLKNYIVVFGMDKLNTTVTEQYQSLVDNALNALKLDDKIQQLSDSIKIPEIKVDKITETTGKIDKTVETASKVSGLLGKFGADTGKVDNALNQVDEINAKVEKIVISANDQLNKAKSDITNQLKNGIEPAIKKEINDVAQKEIQNFLKLSDANYKNFVGKRYGLFSATKRAYTNNIYNEFLKNKTQGLKFILPLMEKYFVYIRLVFVLCAIAITIIPVFLLKSLVGKITSTFSQCPHCNKFYISNKNKLAILSLFK